jgi:predicted DNA-binding transcriptional regulator YafY
MPRSTQAAKARQLNAAHRLLARGAQLSEAAQTLSREFGLSRRQAYRYLEQAARLGHPVPVEEASIPVTIKIPPSTVRQLRSYAASTGLTQGGIVASALREFLSTRHEHD